jgi:hypothetical protein
VAQLFNVSLSYDNRTLLLNQQPVLPFLTTSPHPPRIVASQVAPEFTRANLDETIKCTRERAAAAADGPGWCMAQRTSKAYMAQSNLDYDYYAYWEESSPETRATEQWEVTFDPIAGHYGVPDDRTWTANNTEQYMLQIVIQGTEVEGERYAGEKDLQAGSSLFGLVEESEKVYEYKIVSVDLVKRTYSFSAPQAPSFRKKLRRFFGRDIVSKNGHIVYIYSEWGNYGKLGSLRQYLGVFVHDWPWATVFTILGSTIAIVLAALFACKLFWWVKEQRELARWDGMDTVWANLRRDGDAGGGEEDGLLVEGGSGARYRDEPEDGDEAGDSPPRYTDEVQTNKPLPNKPLPEKPLPAVPLIDA